MRQIIWILPERLLVFPAFPQWKHVLKDHKTPVSLLFLSYVACWGEEKPHPTACCAKYWWCCHLILLADWGCLCAALMSPGGAFKSPLCPRPPVEERHAEQEDLGISPPGQTIVGHLEGGVGVWLYPGIGEEQEDEEESSRLKEGGGGGLRG